MFVFAFIFICAIGSFGGILSLCVGGSVLSVVELFYFVFVRPCTEKPKRRMGQRTRHKQIEPGEVPKREPPTAPLKRDETRELRKVAAPPGTPILQLFWPEFTQNLTKRSRK